MLSLNLMSVSLLKDVILSKCPCQERRLVYEMGGPRWVTARWLVQSQGHSARGTQACPWRRAWGTPDVWPLLEQEG
jgi:hypothetical protein